MVEKILFTPKINKHNLLIQRGTGITIILSVVLTIMGVNIALVWLLNLIGNWMGLITSLLAVLIVNAAIGFGWAKIWIDKLVYGITEEGIIIQEGVLFKKWKTIPFEKITDVIITQGPIETILKIKSVRIQTAGSGQMAIPEGIFLGIKNADETRDAIIKFKNKYVRRSSRFDE